MLHMIEKTWIILVLILSGYIKKNIYCDGYSINIVFILYYLALK